MNKKVFLRVVFLALILMSVPLSSIGQGVEILNLTDESFPAGKPVALNKLAWKYQTGDDLNWAKAEFDDALWQTVENTMLGQAQLSNDWQGRAWFRLHLNVDESLANQTFALSGTQNGAAEIYVDGQKIADFGTITETQVTEYNPNRLPIPFRFESGGRHVIAVRFATETFADMASSRAVWLTNFGMSPGFAYTLIKTDDVAKTISGYSQNRAMGFAHLLIGWLLALALIHFLLFAFYRVERANLFYSFYAISFAILLFTGLYINSGEQPAFQTFLLNVVRRIMFASVFISLLIFLHVAFRRRMGKIFWILIGLWIISTFGVATGAASNTVIKFINPLTIGLTFAFFIYILVQSLRERRPGAWILMIGIQFFSFGMLVIFFREFFNINFPGAVFAISEFVLILAVPLAVSVFLARNFAGVNRNLTAQIEQVEELSRRQIEQEKTAAKISAENDRRMQELEDARRLQLSLLPSKLPTVAGLDIAAYMKPASEVGGDYYDFHIGNEGVLTVAVGDATGHGLKAGSVVTATKGLFNVFADRDDIAASCGAMNRAIKKMNLRGLFMAMTLLKISSDKMTVTIAGMPPALIYRDDSKTVEEIAIRALPLGSLSSVKYQEQEIALAENDVVVLMSDGFPEMFNPQNEMIGFEKAPEILPKIAALSAQQIINELVAVGENWANGRPADDDVTFVVLKSVAKRN